MIISTGYKGVESYAEQSRTRARVPLAMTGVMWALNIPQRAVVPLLPSGLDITKD